MPLSDPENHWRSDRWAAKIEVDVVKATPLQLGLLKTFLVPSLRAAQLNSRDPKNNPVRTVVTSVINISRIDGWRSTSNINSVNYSVATPALDSSHTVLIPADNVLHRCKD